MFFVAKICSKYLSDRQVNSCKLAYGDKSEKERAEITVNADEPFNCKFCKFRGHHMNQLL